MKLKKEAILNDSETVNELMTMFIDYFEYSMEKVMSYNELSPREQEILPKHLFDKIIESHIEHRRKTNFKIINRLTSIADTFPELRFHQILINFKIEEENVDKFNEESRETLAKLDKEINKFVRDEF